MTGTVAASSRHPIGATAVGEVVGAVLEGLTGEATAAVAMLGPPLAGLTEEVCDLLMRALGLPTVAAVPVAEPTDGATTSPSIVVWATRLPLAVTWSEDGTDPAPGEVGLDLWARPAPPRGPRRTAALPLEVSVGAPVVVGGRRHTGGVVALRGPVSVWSVEAVGRRRPLTPPGRVRTCGDHTVEAVGPVRVGGIVEALPPRPARLVVAVRVGAGVTTAEVVAVEAGTLVCDRPVPGGVPGQLWVLDPTGAGPLAGGVRGVALVVCAGDPPRSEAGGLIGGRGPWVAIPAVGVSRADAGCALVPRG